MLWLLFLYLNVMFIPSGDRNWRMYFCFYYIFCSSSLRSARWLAGQYMDNGCLLVCTQTSLSHFYRVQRILSWLYPATISSSTGSVRKIGGRKGKGGREGRGPSSNVNSLSSCSVKLRFFTLLCTRFITTTTTTIINTISYYVYMCYGVLYMYTWYEIMLC